MVMDQEFDVHGLAPLCIDQKQKNLETETTYIINVVLT